jgi:outer membrane protein assembly factor BamB
MCKMISALLLALPLCAQWSTAGADAQRSSWVRSDAKISRTRLQSPGFDLIWKLRLGSQPLTPVAVIDRYIGYRGFRAMGFLAGKGDDLFALDTDLGRVEWRKQFDVAPTKAASTACPGGMTAALTRSVTTAFPTAPPAGRGGGRTNFAKSGVGEPDEGAPIIGELRARAAAAAAAGTPPGGRGRGAGPAGGPPRVRLDYVYAVSSDGKFHSVWISNGNEPDAAVAFLPAGSNVHGLAVVNNNIAYAATTQGCGGAPNAIWSLDLQTKEVGSWKADGGDIAGSAGPALGPDGTLYVATTQGKLVALDGKTLEVKSTYPAQGAGFSTSPVMFQYKDKTLLAAAAKDGRIRLFDAAAIDSPLSEAVVAGGASGALSSWLDPSGTRWLLVSGAGAIGAWKLVEKDDGVSLERGWTSRDVVSPLTPLVINGVVFTASSGDGPAVLYALDGLTGKELWNSGKTIAGAVHGGGISGGGSQLYLETSDGTLYAFGFPIEH